VGTFAIDRQQAEEKVIVYLFAGSDQEMERVTCADGTR